MIHSDDAAFNNSHIPSPDSLVPENEKKRKSETEQHKNATEKQHYSKPNSIWHIYVFVTVQPHSNSYEYYLIHVAKYIGRCRVNTNTHSTVVRVYKWLGQKEGNYIQFKLYEAQWPPLVEHCTVLCKSYTQHFCFRCPFYLSVWKSIQSFFSMNITKIGLMLKEVT